MIPNKNRAEYIVLSLVKPKLWYFSDETKFSECNYAMT